MRVKGKRQKQKTTTIKQPNPMNQLQCNCGGTLELLAELPIQVYNGVASDGTKFTAITRSRYRCTGCNQVSIIKGYVQ